MHLSYFLFTLPTGLFPPFSSFSPFTNIQAESINNMTVSSLYDVLIIGGGPAGLSAATGLARQLYSTVIFDSGVYRNQLTHHMHNVLGWDHADPSEFRKKGREDLLKRYSTVQFQDTKVESVSKTPAGLFELKDAHGKSWTGKKVVIATGIRDIPPDIQGYSDCWARGM